MSSAPSEEITAQALAALRTLLTDGPEGAASLDGEDVLRLVNSLRAADAAEIPLMALARFMDEAAETVPVAPDAHVDQIEIPPSLCRPYHGGDVASLYDIPDVVLLPYDIEKSMFIVVSRCSAGPCVVLWCYWKPACWLLITANSVLRSETADAGPAFPALRLDRILHALSLPARRKSLGVTAKPALYLLMDHIGHHLWHEMTPIFLFPAVVADAGSPPAALTDARMLMAAQRPDQAPDVPIYDLRDEAFAAADRLALAFNMVPSMCLLVQRSTADVFTAAIGERIRLAPPPFLAGLEGCAPGMRGCPDSEAIVFSLRWGNRTLTNTESFFVSLQSLLLQQTSIRRIFITGLNSDFGKYSFQTLLKDSPLEQESLLASSLCHLAQEGMQVVNLVGAPLMDDLAAAACSRAVISPWGAALSKYCWALRMPVIFFSNNELMSGQSCERDIYHTPKYVQDPSYASWVSDVSAVDEASSLSWLPNNARSNFSMDPDLLAASVINHLRMIPGWSE